MTTISRFAPSPTGLLHVGNVRTAIMAWLCARKDGGTFILRIDDTDRERSREDYVDAIRRDLEWLGLTWDREERQSARMDRYDAVTAKLRADGRLYGAYETPAELDLKRAKQRAMGRPPVYDRSALRLSEEARAAYLAEGRAPHWRFMLEQTRTAWDDLVRGEVSIDCASVSDPVLIKEDGGYLYSLCSVVDDMDFGVTHVVRGEDHVTNTATQAQIFEALGAPCPRFAHMALLTAADGGPLSKRLGSLSVGDLREGGVEARAITALLARLGASQPVEPMATLEELAAAFDFGALGRAPARFDEAELTQVNAKIIRSLSAGEMAERLGDVPPGFYDAVRENLSRFDDLSDWTPLLTGEAEPAIDEEDKAFVAQALAMLPDAPWDEGAWGAWTGAVKAATGRKGKALFMPLRRALTGRDHGPEMARLLPYLAPMAARAAAAAR